MELLNKLKGYEVLITYLYGETERFFVKNDIYESVDDFVRDCSTTNSIYFRNSRITIKQDDDGSYMMMFGSEYDILSFKLIAPFDKAVMRELESMF